MALDIDWEKIAMKFALTGGYIKLLVLIQERGMGERNHNPPKICFTNPPPRPDKQKSVTGEPFAKPVA